MRKLALLVVLCCGGYLFGGFDIDVLIKRGDANNDMVVDMSDAIYLSNYIYQGGPEPGCMNQADANDDGQVDSLDAVYLMDWLYNGGSAPPSPGPYNTSCKVDQTWPNPGCLELYCDK